MTVKDRADVNEAGPCTNCGRINPSDARFCPACGLPLSRSADAAGASEPPASIADPLIGRIIADRYRILSLLGRGGMGVVYKAEHVHIGKLMAVKLLHGELARDRETIKRFRREAEAASKLSHPNTVQIFDFGRSEGLMYLVMEYIEGDDLGQLVQNEGALTFARAARICAQVCASVEEAHVLGIVHRDLKPENVMTASGRGHPDFVKVLDFGLAKLREEGPGTVTVTRAGHIVGTPYYMSPEQIRGEEVDGRGDVYAIGAMLYKACTGVPPFSAPTPMGVLTKHLTEDLVPPSERSSAGLPPHADAIVTRAMAKDADGRYARAADLRHDLLEYLAAVGEDPGPAGMSGSASGLQMLGSTRRATAAVATRSDVDAYERRITRRGRVGLLSTALVLSGAATAAWWLWPETAARPPASVEAEPNDTPATAHPLPPGMPVEAHLGKRRNEQEGDLDLYAIENPSGERRVIEVDVSAVPNMDILIEVARAGVKTPLLTADSTGVGGAERIPNFPVVGSRYFLVVREKWIAGELPTENVSDAYTIRWSFVVPGPEDEREINDSLELMKPIDVGSRRRGYIGWDGDLDNYCLSQDAKRIVARVEGPAGLDVVLRVIDREASRSFKIDEAGPGEGERSKPVDDARANDTCFEVSAVAVGERRAAPGEPYFLYVDEVE